MIARPAAIGNRVAACYFTSSRRLETRVVLRSPHVGEHPLGGRAADEAVTVGLLSRRFRSCRVRCRDSAATRRPSGETRTPIVTVVELLLHVVLTAGTVLLLNG